MTLLKIALVVILNLRALSEISILTRSHIKPRCDSAEIIFKILKYSRQRKKPASFQNMKLFATFVALASAQEYNYESQNYEYADSYDVSTTTTGKSIKSSIF